MAEEALMRQAKSLAHRSGHSLEDARRAVSDTEAGRQLTCLANGEHRHEKAQAWQGRVFWDRAEERSMDHFGSEAPSRFVAERHYSWLESYLGWLEGKEERVHYHALLEEELASLRGRPSNSSYEGVPVMDRECTTPAPRRRSLGRAPPKPDQPVEEPQTRRTKAGLQRFAA